MLFLGDDEIPSKPDSVEIGPADAGLPRFPIPGAGMEPDTLEPQPILKGASGRIRTPAERAAPDPRVVYLNLIRKRVEPIVAALARTPKGARQVALDTALGHFRLGGADRVNKAAMKMIARGTRADIALREALTREVAATVLTMGHPTYLPPGWPKNQPMPVEGLGGVLKSLVAAGETVAKVAKGAATAVVDVTETVVDVVEDVACSPITSVAGQGASLIATGGKSAKGGPKRAIDKACGVTKSAQKGVRQAQRALRGGKPKKKVQKVKLTFEEAQAEQQRAIADLNAWVLKNISKLDRAAAGKSGDAVGNAVFAAMEAGFLERAYPRESSHFYRGNVLTPGYETWQANTGSSEAEAEKRRIAEWSRQFEERRAEYHAEDRLKKKWAAQAAQAAPTAWAEEQAATPPPPPGLDYAEPKKKSYTGLIVAGALAALGIGWYAFRKKA